MKQFFKRHALLFLSVFLITGVFLFEKWFFLPQLFKPDYLGFQNEILKQESEMQKQLTFFETLVLKTDKKKGENLLPLELPDGLSQKYSFFVFEQDTLVYWNNNNQQIGFLYSESPLKGSEQHIVKLNNGWYLKHILYSSQYTLVMLLKIKEEYPYQNKFLQDRFHGSFDEYNLLASTKISEIPITTGLDIYSNENEYLFSLKLPKENTSHLSEKNWVVMLFFVGLFFLLIYARQEILLASQKNRHTRIFVLTAGVALFIKTIQVFQIPSILYLQRFFDPILFADSHFSSLGDYVLTVLILGFISLLVKQFLQAAQAWKPWILYVLFMLFSLWFLWIFVSMVESMVLNSVLEFIPFQIGEFNIFAYTAFLAITLLVLSYLVFNFKAYDELASVISLKIMAPIILVISLAIVFLFEEHETPGWISALFFLINHLAFAVLKSRKRAYYFYSISLHFLVASIFVTVLLTESNNTKQFNISKLTVNNIATERDNTAEYLLKDLFNQLQSDQMVRDYLMQQSATQLENIHYYLKRNYFDGFWKRYDMEVTICGDLSRFDPSGRTLQCHNYYAGRELDYGTPILDPYIFFIDDLSGTITYLLECVYTIPFVVEEKTEQQTDSVELTLYIELNSRLQTYQLGYPELLLDEKVNQLAFKAEHSYARYSNNRLINKSGDFNYIYTDKVFRTENKEGFYKIKLNDHFHYVKIHDDKNLTVLSSPALSFLDLLVITSYTFVLLLLVLFVVFLVVSVNNLKQYLRPDFKNRLRYSMMMILVVSFALIGIVAVYYTIQQYKNLTSENLKDKIQSILMEVDHKLAKEKNLTENWTSVNYDSLDELLLEFSVVFLSDINFYDTKGQLIGTSRPEVFSRGLTGKNMHPDAVKELMINKKSFFVHQEQIGQLEYTSAYVPFENIEKNLLGYINLPYFTKPGILEKQITNQIITFVNIYVVLFILALFIAVLLSDRIIYPLRLVQNRFKAIELDKKNELIEYQGTDEIADLVKVYNMKVQQLAENVEKLAKSEREGAWREMAKQIAHEVKNPLTPMKLGVQFLMNSWNTNAPDFETRLKSVTNTIIEQINNLTSIANEFSDFARVSKTKNEQMDVVKKMRGTFSLFESMANLSISLETNGLTSVYVVADPDQISRVFINLIKNGIQAIPSDREGKIHIEMSLKDEIILTSITDNGTGITDEARNKLFVPNFTTKSSGMGLGLAIVKNIIENAGGDIWFETQKDVGTTFFVKFPVVELPEI